MGVERGGVELFVVDKPLTLETAPELAAFVRERGFDAIAIDTLNSAMGTTDQNEMASAASLKALALALPDTAIVVSVYERKSAAGADSDLSAVAGSNAIGGAFDAAVRLKPVEGSRTEYTLESTRDLTTEPAAISIEAQGDEHAMCFQVKQADMLGAGDVAAEITSKAADINLVREKVNPQIVNWHTLKVDLRDGMTVRQWLTTLKLGNRSYDHVKKVLNELVDSDQLIRQKCRGRNNQATIWRPIRDDDPSAVTHASIAEYRARMADQPAPLPQPDGAPPRVPPRVPPLNGYSDAVNSTSS